jgi:hypothetical protein
MASAVEVSGFVEELLSGKGVGLGHQEAVQSALIVLDSDHSAVDRLPPVVAAFIVHHNLVGFRIVVLIGIQ